MELCDTCKNKQCSKNIIVIEKGNLITIKCLEYEKDEEKIHGYIKPLQKTAKLEHTVMRELISDWSNL